MSSRSARAPSRSPSPKRAPISKKKDAASKNGLSFSVAVGWVNLAYLSCAFALGWFVNYRVCVAMTSWVHYLKYIHQYYFRAAAGNQALYSAWQRDVLLYKTVALGHLAFAYLGPYAAPHFYALVRGDAAAAAAAAAAAPSVDYVSLLMIASGYAVSIMATKALGINGTYFGIELGFVKADYQFVKVFPYNTLPHPMILGQVFGLLGIFKAAHVSGGPTPWLIPVHVALYFAHMTQEIYDVWKGDPWFKTPKAASKA